MTYNKHLVSDFQVITDQISDLANEFRNQKVLITGSTGFFGQWYLYFLIYLKTTFAINFEVLCLSRNPEVFLDKHPEIKAAEFIKWQSVDLNHSFKLTFEPTLVLHMATDVYQRTVKLNRNSFNSIANSTQNILNALSLLKTTNKVKFLLTSSGAVYGPQPNEVNQIQEDYLGSPSTVLPSSYYAEGKRASEILCTLYAEENSNFHFTIVRCFAFAGPFLPLDSNYAIGNFVNDCLNGKNIIVQGDGTALRSYMYGADLSLWLSTILHKGKSGQIYNIGSDQAISIGQLAKLVSEISGKSKFQVLGQSDGRLLINKYVPSIEKAKTQFGLKINFDLSYCIQKMLSFNEGLRK